MKKIKLPLVGREQEAKKIRACLSAGKNVLMEGPVGVGKTHLALAITQELGKKIFRVDGDSRYTEQKLTGWFDPPLVVKKGFVESAFVPGPLTQAMKEGGVLFVNELNRLPEGVQNVLLPSIDEKLLDVPRLGQIRAKPGFQVVATQNPKEFVATSHLSEAILDRFELVVLDYQPEEEERLIVRKYLESRIGTKGAALERLVVDSVRLIRATRNHPRVRRGASIRAALSVAEIAAAFLKSGEEFESAILAAALIALPTRIEIERDAESELTPREEIELLIREWLEQDPVKKNS